MQTSIYLFEQHSLLGDSISWIVESIGIKVKKFTDEATLFEEINLHPPNCLLLDIQQIEEMGLSIQLKLTSLKVNFPIIFISSCEDIPTIVKVIQNGAFDYFVKPFNDFMLLEAINNAVNLNKIKNKAIQDKIDTKYKLDQLSPREFQVLQGILEGDQSKIISAKLKISAKTVETYRSNLMKKMKVKSVSELVKLMYLQNLPAD